MSNKLEHAIGLYLEGIRDGRMQAALDAHVGGRYTQHSTGVRDGKEGFLEFFGPFLERNPVRDIRIVRAIEDGQYVFLHVYQSLNNGEMKWVTADLFDTEEETDRLIEHWDVIQEFVEDTVSGRSLVDGPKDIEDLEKTQENKGIVRGFVSDVLLGGQADKATTYVSTEQYDQHNPNIEDGIEGFGKYLQELMATGQSMEYVEVGIRRQMRAGRTRKWSVLPSSHTLTLRD